MQEYLRPEGDYRAVDRYLARQGAKRVFLVCGRSLQGLRLGAYFAGLEGRTGIQVVRFSGFTPNPRYEEAAAGAALFRAAGCDLIAAAGGGSAMDVAKCVKLFAGMDPGENYLRQAVVPNAIPLLAAPTTAGTGSEATQFAVIYEQGVKRSVSHGSALPGAVLLDPSLLEGLPEYQRKSTMLDALCHGLESFWSVRAGEESRGYARAALGLILKGKDGYLAGEAAGNAVMLRGAHLAGKAINLTTTTAGHALSYGLTKRYGIAHGHAAALCVGKLWPYMARKGGAGLERTFGELAQALGCPGVEEAVAWYSGMLAGLGLPGLEPREGDLAALAAGVDAQRLGNNPVPLDRADILELYREILA